MKGKLFIALLIAVLAYLVSRFARHESMKFHRWRLIHEYLPEFGEAVGLGSKYNISRTLINVQYQGKYHGNQKVKVTEQFFNGMRSIVYQPHEKSSEGRPAIIFIHGGGWVKGTPETLNDIALEIVQRLEIAVISFDYRKAPEHVFPAGFNDCLRGIIALSGEAKSLDIDPFRLAILGESSGGNIAAGLAGEIARMDNVRNKLSVKLLILFNPILQALDFNLPSYRAHNKQFMMTKETLLDFWLLYITGETSPELRASLLTGEHLDKKAHERAREIIYTQLNKNKKKSEKLKQAPLKTNQVIVEKLKTAISDPRASPILIPSYNIDMLPTIYVVTCEHDITKNETLAWRDHLLQSNAHIFHRHYDFYHSILAYFAEKQAESIAAVDDFIGHMLRNALL